MKSGDVLEKGAEVTVWIYQAGSYRKLEKYFVMRKLKNFTDHCIIIGPVVA
jgi:hypothetical protein